MLGRVATFALSEKMIQSALRSQSRTVEIELQEASGNISDTFGGLGATSRRVLDLQTSIAQSTAYSDAATNTGSRIEVMYSACTQMTDLLTTLRSSIVSATDAGTLDDGTLASLTTAMSEYMDEFASLLNTQYEGRYLFSGAMTDTKPVDVSSSAYPAQTTPSTASTSYYNGDDEIASVRVSSEQVVQYGVTADNPAFEKALRAFNLMSNMSSSTLDSDTLTEALSLAEEALSGVSSIQTKLSINASTMESAVSMQTTFQDQASSLESNLTDVDVAAASAELSTRQAQLEAAYSAINKIQSLNLVDYLK
ncbi:MAG: flagellin [Rhodoplanes sp.]|uniref:flagellin n=1 Tax=Rhodoplanes sp. TaxID=1968906 RepID=UPI00179BE8F7|nr:flagellin [Rhodoplanes sp.]NVO16628.1 flagellin [Rhodoplanes sp.]